jgi:hypothetical protein
MVRVIFLPAGLQFWRAAVPPGVTRDEVDFVERALGLARPGQLLDLPVARATMRWSSPGEPTG